MTKKPMYEGKAKQVFATENPDELLVYFKDDATAFNGEKKGTIGNKGVFNNKISTFFFNLLSEKGIPHHFIKMLNDREMLVKKLAILPIEVVVRNIAAGSLAKRIGWEEGRKLPSTVVELYYKDDALGDPLINQYHIKALGLATPEQVEIIEKYALQINEVLSAFLKEKKIELIDFKLEFGVHKGEVILGDEISPDTCRFWDSETSQKLDKDRFRRDLGNVEEAYQEVLYRLTGRRN
ncbi:Phosphoribosylaminoimidazole-succinocarboxamide synthase [Sporomusa ovata DSM 2662]|uniref:Phosphoribosylaminoimidazole-succinocarboxamide synthase n=1 Tax=Sporomusa ovata TaxID=2378 RepID=A0A0U1KZ04_9FIRM|nr:phosphoribosylaminoimidazolesuccinocarboxamide synthase [Sporomusa ovata]EQB28743.1 phosphoribosylaminoimidazole-succinocarboxamide synthase [Sporomusa ovata DSM 2662]CQR71894.1 Phosphoribosylaminoimidazole-succinocarboxamide synthase [Sporomusa ovata]